MTAPSSDSPSPAEATSEPESHGLWSLPDDLYSIANVRGDYNPMRFVVRIQPDLMDRLRTNRGSAIRSLGRSDLPLLSAFGTLLHETIHWWQHVGSTTGLMLSFAYPAQSHLNHRYLLDILKTIGPLKSLKSVHAKRIDSNDETSRCLNRILNNWHDIEFNRRIILSPLRVQDNVVGSQYFDSVGHCQAIAMGAAVALLAWTVDKDLRFLPDPRKWDAGFEDLRKRKVRGHHAGSEVVLVPIGAYSIFEGQARFSQLQYLHMGTGGTLGWSDFKRMGLLGSKYLDAFEKFLKMTSLDWPSTPIHPTVNLFLLVCDLAMNPCDGYPFDVFHFDSFIVSNDPSTRFMLFAQHIGRDTNLSKGIVNCSREEYLDRSTLLCRGMTCRQPVEMSEKISSWRNQDSVRTLMREDEVGEFGDENLPVRFFFAKHLRFVEDRLTAPEFFCWPAMYMTDAPSRKVDLSRSEALFNRHYPPFTAVIGGEVRPSIPDGRNADKVQDTFNAFYGWNSTYEMVRQWTVADGPFVYDYSWLQPNQAHDAVKSWADKGFRQVFGVAPDDFRSA